MRVCAVCSKPDAPWWEPNPCSCHLKDVLHDDDPNPGKHDGNCRAIGHEVIMYPVRIAPAELAFDKTLPAYWKSRGWELQQNGQRWYRVKMLCRECIQHETLAVQRRADYERLCRAAAGVDEMTYAQMLASQ